MDTMASSNLQKSDANPTLSYNTYDNLNNNFGFKSVQERTGVTKNNKYNGNQHYIDVDAC